MTIEQTLPPLPADRWVHTSVVKAYIDEAVRNALATQAPALTDEQEIEAFSKWFGAVPDNASPQVLGIAHFAQNAWLARALLAAASPTPTEDARLAKELLRAKNLIRCLWDAYPEARKDIEANTGAWFVWGADRDAIASTQTKGEKP